jgi:hypothetical protein
MALTKVGKEGITGIDNSSDATAITITSAENIGIGMTPNSNYGKEVDILSGTSNVRIKLANSTTGSSNTDGFDLIADGNGAYIWNRENDILVFATNNDEKMRIDSSGRLLLGATVEGEASADDLTVAGSANTGITIRAGTSNSSSIYMSDATSGTGEYAGYIAYAHASDSMSFGTNAGSSMTIDSTGAVTKPKQPAFHAQKNGIDQNNFAIGGKTIVWAAERFDQNNDFDLTENRFTAPITGKYFLQIQVRLENMDTAATYYILNITTSNEGYNYIVDPDYFDQDAVYYTIGFSVLADMDANDTATVSINQNAGTAQTDIDGNPEYTWFSGYLVC